MPKKTGDTNKEQALHHCTNMLYIMSKIPHTSSVHAKWSSHQKKKNIRAPILLLPQPEYDEESIASSGCRHISGKANQILIQNFTQTGLLPKKAGRK